MTRWMPCGWPPWPAPYGRAGHSPDEETAPPGHPSLNRPGNRPARNVSAIFTAPEYPRLLTVTARKPIPAHQARTGTSSFFSGAYSGTPRRIDQLRAYAHGRVRRILVLTWGNGYAVCSSPPADHTGGTSVEPWQFADLISAASPPCAGFTGRDPLGRLVGHQPLQPSVRFLLRT